MKSRSLVEALLAIAGIWLVAREMPDYAVSFYLAATQGFQMSGSGTGALAFIGLRFVASLAVGSVLLLGRKPLARWIQGDDAPIEFSADALFSAGVAVLGIYFFTSGLVRIWQDLFLEAQAAIQPNTYLVGAASILLGLLLFLGAPGISSLWRKLRGGM